MVRHFSLRLPLILLLIIGVAGCSAIKKSDAQERVEVADNETLVSYLRTQGLSMLDNGPVTAPEMTEPGHSYTLTTGGELYVFEFPNEANTLVDVGWLERGREVEGQMHLYRKNKLVVVYLGDDPRVERALTRALGSRIS